MDREDMFCELLVNHKGKTCVVDGRTFCQEGWCSGCWIYRKTKEPCEVCDVKDCPGKSEAIEYPKGCLISDRSKKMTTHVHVYRTSHMVEVDVDAIGPEKARAMALEMTEGMPLDDPRVKRPDCALIAIIPKEQ